MRYSHQHSRSLLLLLFFLSAILMFISKVQAGAMVKHKALNNSVQALFVFGDSAVDPGNNNYIETTCKGNFPPYGQDFVNHMPTGRFTNGRLGTDFIASYVGLKEYVPPYLDPTLSMEELLTGVSFASSASGFDPLTAQLCNVLPMSQQLDDFREYKSRVEKAIGKNRTDDLIKNAVFLVCAGTNDFMINYFTAPIRRKSYTLSSYQQFLMQNIQQFIKGLLDEGARKIGFYGLPPMGCLPTIITRNSNNPMLQRGCIESYSSTARDYNQKLQKLLKTMQNIFSSNGSSIVYVDIYKPTMHMIQEPNKFGFDEVSKGCCGTGFLEVSFSCNLKSPVCADTSKYVFWDCVHPTEMGYYNLFKAAQSTIDFLIRN